MEVDEECHVTVVFDPNYVPDSAHTRYLTENIQVTYSQHPNKVIIFKDFLGYSHLAILARSYS